jgi:5-methylcytosine-specific restriction endonuclease McrA
MQVCEKLYVEEYDGDNVLRSPTVEFKVPSVVRLRHYINVRRKRRDNTMKRARIYIRDRYRCQYCSEHKPAKELTLDHILPRAQGNDTSKPCRRLQKMQSTQGKQNT